MHVQLGENDVGRDRRLERTVHRRKNVDRLFSSGVLRGASDSR